MENLLLILDELDDALATLRALWPQLCGFLLACVLFVSTILITMQWPVVVGIVSATLVCWAWLPAASRKFMLRLKTDP